MPKYRKRTAFSLRGAWQSKPTEKEFYMYEIIKKRNLAANIAEYVVAAPRIAKHAMPGQFVILRVDEQGERVPFTICNIDRKNGTISMLVQEIGYTTKKLARLNEGDALCDLVGPLGKPTDLSEHKNICLIGGGIGAAVIYLQAKFLHAAGQPCDIILGARSLDLVIYKKEFARIAKNLYIVTDDGVGAKKGYVTNELSEQIPLKGYDCVFAVGPAPMMRAVCNITAEFKLPTVVSMNSVMVDGTGMCGGCRVTVDGRARYACVDGPEFDGHLIDWTEAMNRTKAFAEEEKEHLCRLTNQ